MTGHTRLARYRNLYTCILDDPADPTFWDEADYPDPDTPRYPTAANLLVLLEDLRILVEGDPTLDDDAAADLAATIDATWADLSAEYDRRAAVEVTR